MNYQRAIESRERRAIRHVGTATFGRKGHGNRRDEFNSTSFFPSFNSLMGRSHDLSYKSSSFDKSLSE